MEDEDSFNNFDPPPSSDTSAYDSGYEPSPSSVSGRQTFSFTADAMLQLGLRVLPSHSQFVNYQPPDEDDSVWEDEDEDPLPPLLPATVYRPRSMSDSILTRPIPPANLLDMQFLPNWSLSENAVAVSVYRSFRGVPRVDVITFLLTLPTVTRTVATQTMQGAEPIVPPTHPPQANGSNANSPVVERPLRTLPRTRSVSERGEPLPDLLPPAVRCRSASAPQDPAQLYARRILAHMEDFEATTREAQRRRRNSTPSMFLRALLTRTLPSRRQT